MNAPSSSWMFLMCTIKFFFFSTVLAVTHKWFQYSCKVLGNFVDCNHEYVGESRAFGERLTRSLLSMTVPHILKVSTGFSTYALNHLYMICKTSRL